MRCGICSRVVRKTNLVYAPDASGKLKRTRACADCARRGLIVVPRERAASCLACAKPATHCAACAELAARRTCRDIAGPLAKKLRGLARAYPGERGEGLAQAADILEAGEA